MMLMDSTVQLSSVGLRGCDLMSMYCSVETRSVFLRKEIVKFALNLPLKFKIKEFGKSKDIQTNMTESFDANSFAEIIFLTKYLGDYDIAKYGEKYLIENTGYTLVLTK